jgi:Membrane bound O-acyl transferase family
VLYQVCIAHILGIVTYYLILKSENVNTKQLIAYGFIIPALLYLPFPYIEFFDIRGQCLRLCLSAVPITSTLKCLEAMYGFAPDNATSTLRDFLKHFSFIHYPKIDNETKKMVSTSVTSIVNSALHHIKYTLAYGIVFSILKPYEFEPFPSKHQSTDFFVAITVKDLLNNFVAAITLSFMLEFTMNGIGIIIQAIGGFETEAIVDNPMLASISPSDFWGKRWNLLIHRGLKQGIYKPNRYITGSRNFSTFITFLASGLLHEYVWAVLFLKNSREPNRYIPPHGKNILFFGWNGCLLLIEHLVGRARWNQLVGSKPRLLVGLLVVMTALPIGHLFTGDMIRGGFFDSLIPLFPMIVVNR